MIFELFVCAKVDTCGRPFRALAIGRIGHDVTCPYCGESAEQVDDFVRNMSNRELKDVIDRAEREMYYRESEGLRESKDNEQ